MTRRAISLLALLAMLLAAVGAAQGGSRRAADGQPLALAAASLTEVLPRIEPNGRFSFAGSNQLATQIRQGAPFDVFFSASPVYTQALYAEGLVRKPVAFATNDLVVVVPRSNPARLATLADLARRPKLRLVVAGPKVPIGLYTREVLKRVRLLKVLRKTVSLEPDVKGIVGKVALGEADAGFVYATDVTPVRNRVRVIPIPRRAQPTVTYELAVASKPQDLAAAQELVISVLGPEGRRALRAGGFGTP
ncbi:MAG TPA: molybdate ABC transporter substrate-binding protein [Gaiellaceae bacterium]|nr:molybdate ABC transporter substrate-binding protein [Gaiellaceae bacterium]